jgi:cystathionine beta-lyase/cystathionine gamma-synthase
MSHSASGHSAHTPSDAAKLKFSTRAIHVGQDPDAATGDTIPAIHLSSTFTQQGIGGHKGFEYSRSGNPTRANLETTLAAVEGGRFGLSFASGLAAMTTLLHTLKPGDQIIAGDDLYGGSVRLFDRVLGPWNVQTVYVPAGDPAAYAAAVTDKTRMIWLETPTNPLMRLVDIAAVAGIAAERKIPLAVDNTFASPYLQNPLALGATVAVHSTTKYIGGHSDIVGGALVMNDEELYTRCKFLQNAMGSVPGPFDCWLTSRGLKTLAVRMERHQSNAMAVARFLASHPAVKAVYYPGLPDHPQHELAKRQMRGFGGMLSFRPAGGRAAVEKFVTATRVFALAESLGGVESLICHPVTMTHGSIPAPVREKRGVTDDLLRLSVGIEDESDLIADLDRALAAAK